MPIADAHSRCLMVVVTIASPLRSSSPLSLSLSGVQRPYVAQKEFESQNPIKVEHTHSKAEDEVPGLVFEDWNRFSDDWRLNGVLHDQNRFLYDKVTVLESEKRAWENSPEAQAIRDALNPWRKPNVEASKDS